jgi:hypothetical protein
LISKKIFSETAWPNESKLGRKYPWTVLFENAHLKFQFIWESGFRGEDCLEINQSETRMAETTLPNKLKFGRKHLSNVFYKVCSIRPDPLTNMDATGNSCF